MLELLLIEFRTWNRDWDNYLKYPEHTDKPPTQEEFIFYLREKYPELRTLDNITAGDVA